MTVSECCLIKLLTYILFEKYVYSSIGNGQPREPALCQLYRHTFVPDDHTTILIVAVETSCVAEIWNNFVFLWKIDRIRSESVVSL